MNNEYFGPWIFVFVLLLIIALCVYGAIRFWRRQ